MLQFVHRSDKKTLGISPLYEPRIQKPDACAKGQAIPRLFFFNLHTGARGPQARIGLLVNGTQASQRSRVRTYVRQLGFFKNKTA